MTDKSSKFNNLCDEARNCDKCPRMRQSKSVLGNNSGPLSASVMFIAEAPGRLGAEKTGKPMHGDRTGDNFECLLKSAGINRDSLFITNAVLCCPKDKHGNNATPNKGEIRNCMPFLRRQIDLVDPKIVVTLGKKALDSLYMIERHKFTTLKTAIRTTHQWNGRTLIPMYHPSPQAVNRYRNLDEQKSDYQFLAEQLRKKIV